MNFPLHLGSIHSHIKVGKQDGPGSSLRTPATSPTSCTAPSTSWRVATSPPAEYSDPRQGRLNHAWSALNDVGREEAEKRVSELTEIASYTLDKGVALQAKEA